MFLSQISVSAHSAALAYRIRLRGNERGTPLPFNLKLSGCRQHRFSPVVEVQVELPPGWYEYLHDAELHKPDGLGNYAQNFQSAYPN